MAKSAALNIPPRQSAKKRSIAFLIIGGLLSATPSCATEKALADARVEGEPPYTSALPGRVEPAPAADEPSKQTEARAAVDLSDKEQVVLWRLLIDDFRGYTEGGDALFGRGADASDYVAVNADDLQTQYERNEVAGDKKFRGKRLILSGKVASIDRSIGENYFVSLRGGTNQFMRPKAMMADGHTDYLAELEKGQAIRLVCKGDGMLMGSAMVSGCIPTASWVEQMTTSKMNELPHLVRTKDKSLIQLLAIAIGLTAMLPETSPCLSKAPMAPGDRCSKDIELAGEQLNQKLKLDAEFRDKLTARLQPMRE